jgi:hypothetical protein
MVSVIINTGDNSFPPRIDFKIEGLKPDINAVPLSSKRTGKLSPLDCMFQKIMPGS